MNGVCKKLFNIKHLFMFLSHYYIFVNGNFLRGRNELDDVKFQRNSNYYYVNDIADRS